MDYTIIRSNRKTMALEVKQDGSILIRAPLQLPQNRIDQFVQQHRQWIEAAQSRQQVRQAVHPEPNAQEILRLKAKAKELLPGKVAAFAKIMGLSPAGITITSARTRFGSCSSANRLSFSWRLMQYPEAAIDYVVVHELAHIVHKNHSPAFYALIEKYLPDHKQRRVLLKE